MLCGITENFAKQERKQKTQQREQTPSKSTNHFYTLKMRKQCHVIIIWFIKHSNKLFQALCLNFKVYKIWSNHLPAMLNYSEPFSQSKNLAHTLIQCSHVRSRIVFQHCQNVNDVSHASMHMFKCMKKNTKNNDAFMVVIDPNQS